MRSRALRRRNSPRCRLNQNATLDRLILRKPDCGSGPIPFVRLPATGLVDFNAAPLAPSRGIRYANNDGRCHRHDACDRAGIRPKRGPPRHGAASGQAGHRSACGAATPATHAAPIKPAAASTPESRSAAALALSHEPTFDEGTAQRIKEAALSYSDLAVRGGWPMIPADAKFAHRRGGPERRFAAPASSDQRRSRRRQGIRTRSTRLSPRA